MPVTIVTGENPAGEVVPSQSDMAANGPAVAAASTPTPAEPASPAALSDQNEDDPATTAETGKESRIEQRFSEMTKRIRAAEARAEAAEARAETRQAQTPTTQQPAAQTTAQPATNDEPDPTTYTDPFKFQRDLALWAARQTLAQDKQQTAAKQVVSTWQQRVDAAKADIPDFEQVLLATESPNVSDDVRDAIIESELGPAILYHLAKNPAVAKSLQGLSSRRQMVELGKIEASLTAVQSADTGEQTSTNPAPAVVKTSKAPQPIAPIRGTGKTADIPIDHNGVFTGKFQDYVRLREAGKIGK